MSTRRAPDPSQKSPAKKPEKLVATQFFPERTSAEHTVALERAWNELGYRGRCCCATCDAEAKCRGVNDVSRVCAGCFVDVHQGKAPNYRRRRSGDRQLSIASAAAVAPSEGRRPMRALTLAACIACLLVLAPGLRAGTDRSSSAAALRQLVASRFAAAGPTAVRRAFCIVGRESHWNPRAVSSTGDYGLFQINWSAHHRSYDWSRILEPGYNTAVAWRLATSGRDWRRRGLNWHPWDGGTYRC